MSVGDSTMTVSCMNSNQWCLPVCNCIHVFAELAVYMMSRCNCRQVCRFTSVSESLKMCGVVHILSPLGAMYLQFKQTQASFIFFLIGIDVLLHSVF